MMIAMPSQDSFGDEKWTQRQQRKGVASKCPPGPHWKKSSSIAKAADSMPVAGAAQASIEGNDCLQSR